MPTDMDRFNSDVATVTDQLQAVWTGYDAGRPPPLGVASNDERNQVVEEVLNQIYEDATQEKVSSLGSQEDIRVAAMSVRSALQTPSTRARICSALQAATGKSNRELAVEITKMLLPLAVAGQIVLPVSALVWGILGFAVAAIGTTWLCSKEN
jgi:hypothetical protein